MTAVVLTGISDTGLTNTGSGAGSTGSIAVPAGSERVIIACLLQLVSTDAVALNGLGIGGTDFTSSIKGTERVNANSGGGFPAHGNVWTFTEAQIQSAGVGANAAGNVTFRVSGTTAGDRRLLAVVLGTTEQTGIVDSGSSFPPNFNSQAPAFNLSTTDGGYAAAFQLWDRPNSGTAGTDWGTDLTEQTEFEIAQPGPWTISSADAATDGTSVSVAATTTGGTSNQNIVVAVTIASGVINKSSTATIAGTGEITAASRRLQQSAATIAGVGQIVVAAQRVMSSRAIIDGKSDVVVAGAQKILQTAAEIAGQGEIIAGAARQLPELPIEEAGAGAEGDELTVNDIDEKYQPAEPSIAELDDEDLEAVLGPLAQLVVRSLVRGGKSR